MKRFFVFTALLLAAFATAPAQTLSEREFVELKTQCFKDDIAACKKLIAKGNLPPVEQCDKVGCGEIGQIYYIAEKYNPAKIYAEKACDEGVAMGCNVLGILYYQGKGVKQNQNAGVMFYGVACDGDYMAACANLAQAYYKGDGVEQDYFMAAELHKKACDGDYMRGCVGLGRAYIEGEGVKQDYFKARKVFEKACDGGDASGCVMLGGMYVEGKGVRQDIVKAVELAQKACDGDIIGEYNRVSAAAGCLVLAEISFGFLNDLSAAKAYYGRACDLGDQESCDNYRKLNEKSME